MSHDLQALKDRLAELKRRLSSRSTMAGYDANVAAIRTEIAKLEAEIQERSQA